jgi:WD40 repeat protein
LYQAVFSPVDKVVATGSADRTIKVWSLADGSCLRTLEGHTASVLALSFASAGTQVRPQLILPFHRPLELYAPHWNSADVN